MKFFFFEVTNIKIMKKLNQCDDELLDWAHEVRHESLLESFLANGVKERLKYTRDEESEERGEKQNDRFVLRQKWIGRSYETNQRRFRRRKIHFVKVNENRMINNRELLEYQRDSYLYNYRWVNFDLLFPLLSRARYVELVFLAG